MSVNYLNTILFEAELSKVITLCQSTEATNKKFDPGSRGAAITERLKRETEEVNELFTLILDGQLIEISKQIGNYKLGSLKEKSLTSLDEKIAEYESSIARIQEIVIKRKGGFIYEDTRAWLLRII